MKALTWQGVSDVRVDNVPDPTIQDPTDIIVGITSTGLCGSDLHLTPDPRYVNTMCQLSLQLVENPLA